MSLNRQSTGFTLIELVIVFAILGIMSATAMPFYKTYKQVAYRSEASTMIKSLLHGEIAYFLEHDRFFPEDGQPISIFRDDPPSKAEIQRVNRALNITIPVGHMLDYHIQTFPSTANDSCTIMISAPFPLFRDGTAHVIGTVDKHGAITIFVGEEEEEAAEEIEAQEEEEVQEEEVQEKEEEQEKEKRKWRKRRRR